MIKFPKNFQKYIPLIVVTVIVVSLIISIPSIIAEVNKHIHSYGEWERFQDPKCDSQGIDRRYCDCGDVQQKPIERLPHTPGVWVVDYEDNENKLYCSVCNQVIQTISLEDHTHSFGEWITEIESTCTVGGILARYCRCGAKEEKALKVLEHKFGAWKTLTEATCDEYGLIQSTCSGCGKVKEEKTPMTDHQFISVITTREPTCSQTGITEKACSKCNAVILEELPLRLHDYDPWKTQQEATCNSEGIEIRECKNCDYVEKKVLAVNQNHKYSEWTIISDPTTESKGSKERKCSVCGNTEQADIDMLEYDPKDWTIDQYGKLTEVSNSINGDVSIPSNVRTIGSDTFRKSSITSLTMSNHVTTIESNAFIGCSKLKYVRLSNSIQSIGSNAFSYCAFTSITISNSIKSIGKYAFDCGKLSTIYYGGSVENWNTLMDKIDWNIGVSSYTVNCNNGTISVSGNQKIYNYDQ